MDNTVRIPEALQWSEGMLLTPQHFQQNDIYWQALLRHQMLQLQPHYWGVLELKLDPAALRTGKVRVTSLHAVMPDGLVVQYPAPGQDEMLALDVVADANLRENKPLLVHVAVPVRAEGAASRASSIQRYDSAKGALELDENTGESRIEVPRLRPRLSLIAGDKVPAKYVAMPLLQIRRDIGGHFELTDYHPPLLGLEASRFLGDAALVQQLDALSTRIRAKAKELLGVVGEEAARPNGNAYQAEVVRRLVAALPPFEVMVRSGTVHPFSAYLALAHLVGHVAGIGADPIPMLFDNYRHDNPAPGFYKALRYLAGVLAKLNAAYEATLFERPRDDLYTCTLAPNQRAERLVIELKPQAGQTPQALAQWLNQACVASDAMVPLLRQRRLTGARVRPLPAEQAAALGVNGAALYEVVNQAVEQNDKLVPVIQPGAPLCIQGAGRLAPPAAIVLYTPKRSAQKPAAPVPAVANG